MSIKLQMFSGGPARAAMAGGPFPRAPGAAAVGLSSPPTPRAAWLSLPGPATLRPRLGVGGRPTEPNKPALE
ncbi:mCG147030 [Mus musculus]|nr:mCG147030 [Mus musculus]